MKSITMPALCLVLMTLLAADLDYSAASVGYNLGNAGTVTVGAQMFGISDIPANRENGYTDPILQDLVTDTNTSDTYDYQDLAVSVGYSR